jgi:hypothetical protein
VFVLPLHFLPSDVALFFLLDCLCSNRTPLRVEAQQHLHRHYHRNKNTPWMLEMNYSCVNCLSCAPVNSFFSLSFSLSPSLLFSLVLGLRGTLFVCWLLLFFSPCLFLVFCVCVCVQAQLRDKAFADSLACLASIARQVKHQASTNLSKQNIAQLHSFVATLPHLMSLKVTLAVTRNICFYVTITARSSCSLSLTLSIDINVIDHRVVFRFLFSLLGYCVW